MKELCVIVGFTCIIFVLVAAFPRESNFEIVSREQWGAKPPLDPAPLTTPVPFVVIHHSYIPAACYTNEECVEAMQWMQDFHQINRSWSDIGYNFAVGGDNNAYEGRGWYSVGAHAPTYNNRSIGICIIGDWRVDLPPTSQLETVHRLIQKGVNEGVIAENYQLVAHKQVREGTECPGDRLFEEIQSWDHFTWDPQSNLGSNSVNIQNNNVRKRTIT